MLIHFPVSVEVESTSSVDIITLLDQHFWLSGQGIAGHHPPIPSSVLAFSWPCG